MVIVGFGLQMTGKTGKICVITHVGMTVNTVIPLAPVFATINGKELAVMVESCRGPTGVSGMA
jgi:hypothetical protein